MEIAPSATAEVVQILDLGPSHEGLLVRRQELLLRDFQALGDDCATARTALHQRAGRGRAGRGRLPKS